MTDLTKRYPEKYGACILCGAAIGTLCDTISEPGRPRKYPHHYRAETAEQGPQGRFTAVRDEPDWGEKPTRYSYADLDAQPL